MERLLIRMALLFLCFSCVVSWAQTPCNLLFHDKSYPMAMTTEWFNGSMITTYKIQEQTSNNFYLASRIFPQIPQDKKLIIGFMGSHSYLWFNGYRLDSAGQAGLNVRAYVKKSLSVYGDLLIVLPHLPDSTYEELNHIIKNFKSFSKLTCNRITCSHLQKVNSTLIDKRYYGSSKMIKDLTKQVTSKSLDAKFVELKAQDLSKIVNDFKAIERNIKINYGLTLFLLGIPLSAPVLMNGAPASEMIRGMRFFFGF